MPQRRFVKALAFSNVLLVVVLIFMTVSVQAAGSQKADERDNAERISRLEAKYDDMSALMAKMDRQHERETTAALGIESRLSRLETSQDSIKNLLIALVTGMCLMLMEAGFRLIVSKSKKEKG